MTPTLGLAPVAGWFVLGMTRMVFTSALAEHRIDHPEPGQAMASNRAARTARRDPANYDPRGRRLLPWYRAVNTTYWLVAAGGCAWVVFQPG